MGSIADLKRAAVEKLLAAESCIMVILNPTARGVVLPDYLVSARQPVPLNIGYDMPIPIPDLEIGENGISGTLSFNRSPFHCVLPWSSLLQISVGDEHLVWVLPPAEPEADDEGGDGGGDGGDGGEGDGGEGDGKGGARSHLRLVD